MSTKIHGARGEAVGIMNGAYFVSRTELVQWVNQLNISLSKIEECASGAAYCQIIECMYPGTVQVSKLNTSAKLEYEYLKNYKILQNAFSKIGISKVIPIEKLVKGKYQDNLEFLQWLHSYYCSHFPQAASENAVPSDVSVSSVSEKPSDPFVLRTVVDDQNSNKTKTTTTPAAAKRPVSQSSASAKKTVSSGVSASELAALKEENSELRVTVQGLEKERDFYFGKLRDIEILCQTREGSKQGEDALLDDVRKVLYATEEDFAAIDE
eukprot:ANDGO_01945.mRNA.1 Microtubule-associated protein RP/EB family member 1B